MLYRIDSKTISTIHYNGNQFSNIRSRKSQSHAIYFIDSEWSFGGKRQRLATNLLWLVRERNFENFHSSGNCPNVLNSILYVRYKCRNRIWRSSVHKNGVQCSRIKYLSWFFSLLKIEQVRDACIWRRVQVVETRQ